MSLKTFKFLDKSGFSWPQLKVDAISKIGVFPLCLRNRPFDAFKIPTDRHKTSSAKSLISSKELIATLMSKRVSNSKSFKFNS